MGSWNIDVNPSSPCDIIASIDRLKFRSNTKDTIYASHVFEHVPRAHTERVLDEWYRVLRRGGRLYLCVPDSEALFRIYLDNLPNYGRWPAKDIVDLACGVIYGGQCDKYDFHYAGYSFVTLKSLLEASGFSQVRRFDRSAIEWLPAVDASCAAIEDIPVSLNVEAVK